VNWVPGRRKGGYLKLPLLELGSMDCYLIRYPTGSGVWFHTDEVPGRRHYRLNLLLRKAREGGAFRMLGLPLLSFWRVTLFRPDRYAHAVETIYKGERLVFSLGVALK